MKVHILSIILLAVILGDAARAEHSSDIATSLTPLRESYHPGEPIAVMLSLRNTGDQEVQIAFSYPDEIGISFACPQASIPLEKGGSKRVPYLRLAPGEELRRVIALNRYMGFAKPGRYSIKYAAQYMGPIVEVKGQPGKFTATTYESAGKFVVEVSPGAIDEMWMKQLVAVLEQKVAARTGETAKEKDRVTKEEAVELLQWAETPLVIEPLISAAKGMPAFGPNAAPDIVKALQKFFKLHERARSGIVEIARAQSVHPFGVRAMRAALDVYEKEGVRVSGDWFRPVLRSGKTGQTYFALQYLRKHGDSGDVSLVEPLTKSKNAQIADLAAKIVEELKARGRTTNAPAPDRK